MRRAEIWGGEEWDLKAKRVTRVRQALAAGASPSPVFTATHSIPAGRSAVFLPAAPRWLGVGGGGMWEWDISGPVSCREGLT